MAKCAFRPLINHNDIQAQELTTSTVKLWQLETSKLSATHVGMTAPALCISLYRQEEKEKAASKLRAQWAVVLFFALYDGFKEWADDVLWLMTLFILIYYRSIAKQVIQTYILITLDRLLQMESISFFKRGLRGERSQTCPYMLSAQQGSIWYQYIMFLVWRSRGSNPPPHKFTGRTLYH